MIRKLYISADIEGVCGIADWKETNIGEAQGAYFRDEMTSEVAAACEAANAAGVGEIFVKDAHGSGRSIDPSKLPENVRLMRAWTNDPWSMMAGIDQGFDGALFIGYHSAGGTDGNPLAHTMDTSNVHVIVNGQIASEFLLNAYTAASVGVPSLLVAGDRQLCEGAPAIIPGIATVPVSEGVGSASISIHPALAKRRIGEATAAALASPAPLHALPDRFKVSVLFREHRIAHRSSFFPGAKKTGPLEVAFASKEWFEVIRFLYFVL
jgi:D-amino peptidase